MTKAAPSDVYRTLTNDTWKSLSEIKHEIDAAKGVGSSLNDHVI